MEIQVTSQVGTWRDLVAPGRRIATTLITLNTCIFAFNEFFVSAAVPSAVREFGQIWLLPWSFIVFLVFSITSGAATAGLKARFGGRAVMIGGNGLFIIGSLACVFATGPASLIGGRILQGVGEGLAFGVAYSMIPELFPGTLVAKVFGLEAVAWAVAGFAAPSGAGALTQYYSWRTAFAISVLPAIVLIVLSLFLPRGVVQKERSEGKPYGQLICLAAAILVLSSASRVEFWPALACIAVAAALFFGFFRLDRQSGARILPRGAFSVGQMPGPGLWVILLMPVTGAAGAVYFNFGVQGVMGLGPFNASLLQSLLAISWSCVAVWLAGIEAGWRERMLRVGAPLLIAGYVLLAFGFYSGSLVLAGLAQILSGLGFGMTWGPLSQLLMETAPAEDRDRVSALLPSLQSMGYAIGGAIFGIIAAFAGIAENAAPAGLLQGLIAIFCFALIPAFAALFFSLRLLRR